MKLSHKHCNAVDRTFYDAINTDEIKEDQVIKYLWAIIFGLVLVWSGVASKDQFT